VIGDVECVVIARVDVDRHNHFLHLVVVDV
jgi:hypothetical protein